MFCPTCGSEDRQANQFCRSCGADLRPVQLAVSRPDQITASAASARDEIGRAVAAKIREVQGAGDLARVASAVLPEIEKFLESPEEKRLRRIRVGLILSSIGAGVAIGLSAAALLAGERDGSRARRASRPIPTARPRPSPQNSTTPLGQTSG